MNNINTKCLLTAKMDEQNLVIRSESGDSMSILFNSGIYTVEVWREGGTRSFRRIVKSSDDLLDALDHFLNSVSPTLSRETTSHG